MAGPGFAGKAGTGMGSDHPPVTPGLWKFDMHVHSAYSSDSTNEPEAIIASFARTGIIPLVCDHNSTAGSAVVSHGIRQIAPGIPAILAEEIMTAEGEIIGLFLEETVRPYFTAEETIEAIHEQGGLALVPHPFCSWRRGSALRQDALTAVTSCVDIIEGFNGRTLREGENRAAREFAAKAKKPFSVGSDAHLPIDLGRYWLELEPFQTPEELLKSLCAPSVRYPCIGH